ncbi:hypothetical protein GGF42_001784 [Coemansia sp. RSA 2424]|nr:hypothetical protein GGF42_001784 [Coemansia sp. RSA 2424]
MSSIIPRSIRVATTAALQRSARMITSSTGSSGKHKRSEKKNDKKSDKDPHSQAKPAANNENDGGGKDEQRRNEREQALAAAEIATFGKEGAERVVPASSYKSRVREMHK